MGAWLANNGLAGACAIAAAGKDLHGPAGAVAAIRNHQIQPAVVELTRRNGARVVVDGQRLRFGERAGTIAEKHVQRVFAGRVATRDQRKVAFGVTVEVGKDCIYRFGRQRLVRAGKEVITRRVAGQQAIERRAAAFINHQ